MTVFRGRSLLKIDPKGRLSFPSHFRADLSRTRKLVITNSLYRGETCLDLYSWSSWLQLEKNISRLPDLDTHVQAFRRFYLASGEPCEMDSQGRLLIPQLLREYAQLKDEIVLVGMGSKIEIWSSLTWNKVFTDLRGDFESMQASIAKMQKDFK